MNVSDQTLVMKKYLLLFLEQAIESYFYLKKRENSKG